MEESLGNGGLLTKASLYAVTTKPGRHLGRRVPQEETVSLPRQRKYLTKITTRSLNNNNPDPEGQHSPSCIAGSSGWGRNGWGSSYYDESCSGCRHDRSAGSFGSNNKAKGVFKLLAVVGGVKLAKKSLWD
ncbi:hypothetical protein MAR_027431 [Mya arenaria]|uniref:Uncharacterized protein n=1 Tax=Mya arenaria TaxID=6604 RepID=A0ABY7EX17_MYAAR|nr:hypothetical protein MAR_027431 [Mya arenaria]